MVVWNAAALTKERELTDGLTDRIAAVRFLPDGKQFVIADGLHMNDWGYDCLARNLEAAIVEAAKPAAIASRSTRG